MTFISMCAIMYTSNAGGLVRKRGKGMKKTIRLLCNLMCLFTILVFVFTGCNVTPVFVVKTEPTFKGMFMSVSSNVEVPADFNVSVETETEAESIEAVEDKENNGNTDNNGNHYGWYKDDDGDGKVDEDSQEQLCNVSQNQDVYFYICLNNPDKNEIRSIKIAGQTYTSDMFEANSTDEVKIVKYNVGDASGVVEYTLEEVTYFNGSVVKNIAINGNKTAKASIKAEHTVKAIVNNIELRDSGKEAFFDITILDETGLIAKSNGSITLTVPFVSYLFGSAES